MRTKGVLHETAYRITPVSLLVLVGCAETIYNVNVPPSTQANQYVETDDLGKLPDKKIAITSFGIEFDTHVYKYSTTRINRTKSSTRETSDVKDLFNEVMQSIVDDAYGKLVNDLTAAGYEIIPYDSYRDTPAYQSLIKIIGKTESPVPMTFKYSGIEAMEGSDALVFAPTGMVWYPVAAGEASARYATLTNVGKQLTGALGRGFSGDGNAFVRLKEDVRLDPSVTSYEDIEKHLDAVREMFMTKLKAVK